MKTSATARIGCAHTPAAGASAASYGSSAKSLIAAGRTTKPPMWAK